jgi:hypothetical protein
MSTSFQSDVNPQKVTSGLKQSVMEFLKKFGYIIAVVLFFFFIIKLLSNTTFSLKNLLLWEIGMLSLGIFHCGLIFKYMKICIDYLDLNAILITILLPLIGITLINFGDQIPLIKNINKSYALAFYVFLIPFLFMTCFSYFEMIPKKEYTTWSYPYGKEVPIVEVLNSIKIKFYVTKKEDELTFSEFELNVPTYSKLGDFVHYFFYRYNMDKNPTNPIYYSPENTSDGLYNWNFYIIQFKYFKKYLDPTQSIEVLKIKNNEAIFLERVERIGS